MRGRPEHHISLATYCNALRSCACNCHVDALGTIEPRLAHLWRSRCGGRLGHCRGNHGGNNHWNPLGARGDQYRGLYTAAFWPEGGRTRSLQRQEGYWYRSTWRDRQCDLVGACGLVAGPCPRPGRNRPWRHHHWSSVCLGAPQACQACTVAHRQDGRVRWRNTAQLSAAAIESPHKQGQPPSILPHHRPFNSFGGSRQGWTTASDIKRTLTIFCSI